jgi:hypothetical protein
MKAIIIIVLALLIFALLCISLGGNPRGEPQGVVLASGLGNGRTQLDFGMSGI